jgi:sterol-4alpha-carboxylate 3-dehydrogenase (decarboxylating)
MMGDVCQGLGYPRPRIHLPFFLIIAVAALFEYVIRPLLAPIKKLNTDFTVNRWEATHEVTQCQQLT